MMSFVCNSMSLHVCPGDFFFVYLDNRLAKFWDKTCPFGFLLVAVWL